MARYTKVPVTIEAILAGEVLDATDTGGFTSDPPAVPRWIVDAFTSAVIGFEGMDTVLVNTHHGQARAERADWIIRGVDGELYPCKADVFAKTYAAEEGETAKAGRLFAEAWNEKAKREPRVYPNGVAEIVDQPPPAPADDRDPVWLMVIKDYQDRFSGARGATYQAVLDDMVERDHVGRKRYGTPLTAYNGRDQLVDAYQEAFDLAVYLRAAMHEGLPVDGAYFKTLDTINYLRTFINERMVRKVGT